MRFLFVSFIPDHPWSGMGKWSHRIAAEFRSMGHEATLRFSDHYPRLRATGRLSVILFPPFLALQLVRERRAFDVAVVHEPAGFWYSVLRRINRRLPPMVLVCHNVESRHFRDMIIATRRGFASVGWGSRLKNFLFRSWQSDGAIRLADSVLCLSSSDARYIRRSNESVSWTPNGVDLVGVSPGDRDWRGALFVGGWLDLKGRRLLPQIWRRVIAREPAARLTLVGTGGEVDPVRSEFAPEARESITVVPRITDAEEMGRFYGRNGIFLMPSLSEGSPLALLEAMAAGMGCVAARVGGIPDLVTHRESALLYECMNVEEAASSIVELMENPELAQRLGSSAAHRAGSLTWNATARKLIEAAMRAGQEARSE